MKSIIVNRNAKIISGTLKDKEGLVVGFESHINEVWIQLDEDTTALVKSEMIVQN